MHQHLASIALVVDDYDDAIRFYTEKGVDFTRAPVEELYGTVAVFKDLYGNLWDLIEPILRAGTP